MLSILITLSKKMIPNDQGGDMGVQREIRAKLVGMKLNPLQIGRADLSWLVRNGRPELAEGVK